MGESPDLMWMALGDPRVYSKSLVWNKERKMNKHTLLFYSKIKTRDMQVSTPTGYRHCTHRSLPYSMPLHHRAPRSTAHTDPPQHPGEQQFFNILILPSGFGLKKALYIIVTSIFLWMATEPLHNQKPKPNQTKIGTCDETFTTS